MRFRVALGVPAVALLVIASSVSAGDFKSGPQKPSVKIVAFNPLHCSGPTEGTKACLV